MDKKYREDILHPNPAPETYNPSDWVMQQIRESKGKFLEHTKEFEKELGSIMNL